MNKFVKFSQNSSARIFYLGGKLWQQNKKRVVQVRLSLAVLKQALVGAQQSQVLQEQEIAPQKQKRAQVQLQNLAQKTVVLSKK